MLFCIETRNGVATVNRLEGSTVLTVRIKNEETGNEAMAVFTPDQARKFAQAILGKTEASDEDNIIAGLLSNGR